MSKEHKNNYYNESKKIIIIGAAVNVFLIALKLTAGILGNSLVLIADAFHSLSDLFSDVIIFAGIRIANKPKDDCHQFGHGKFETLSALLVCATLVGVSYGLGKTSIISLIEADYKHPTLLALIAAVISLISKELLFRATYMIGKKAKSDAIILNAWHHRSDAFSSIATIVGVAGAMGGYYMFDSIAAIIVAVLIFKLAVGFGLKAIDELVEKSIPTSLQKKIIDIVKQCEGVMGFHKLRTRKVGNHIFLDIHVLVNPELTVSKGHEIASVIKITVMDSFEEDIDVLVHIEPYK
jgi:cation diffusion facilitator family transporter